MTHTNTIHADGPAKTSKVHRTFLVLVFALAAIPAWKLYATLPSPTMQMQVVMPVEARPGDVVMVTGHALDRAHVDDVYLIDDQNGRQFKVDIIRATGTELEFRVPMRTPAGLMGIAVKVPYKAGLIDQFLYLKVLEPVG